MESLFGGFKSQAELRPNNVCLVDGSVKLSYYEVLKQTEALAATLQSYGVTEKSVVALYCEKNHQSVISFLALNAIGADVLTLDLAFPAPMLEYTLQDSATSFVLSDRTLPIELGRVKSLLFSTLFNIKASSHAVFYPSEINSHWIVYSSGSTGKPKGIKISEKAILTSIYSRFNFSKPNQDDRIACCIYFYWEVFRPLFMGASIHLLSDHFILDFSKYIKYLINHKITETLWTPSFSEMLVKYAQKKELNLLNLKRIWINGEVITQELSNRLINSFPNVSFYNLYSISETFDVSAELLTLSKNKKFSSIGKPLSHIKLKVLDDKHNECEPNQNGELYIGGSSLCEGYLNQPKLTNNSFLYLMNNGALEKYFKTGDVAYRGDDNQVYILGRKDSVVKLRGYNVSLLSIESILKEALPIKQCVVKLNSTFDEPFIEVYMSIEDEGSFIKKFELDPLNGISQKLRAYLSNFLPHYSLPNRFFITSQLTINPYSSKLERKNLKEKCFSSETEKALTELWSTILSINPIEIKEDSNFFDLGASSLQAVEYVHQFANLFARPMSIEELFKCPTFSDQLTVLKKSETSINKSSQNNFLNNVDLPYFDAPRLKQCAIPPEISAIFVTGASGFLGANWLSQAFDFFPNATFYCLIRQKDKTAAINKLNQSFINYGLPTTNIAKQVVAVTGTLESHKFGLDDSDWNYLCDTIDFVFHAAAEVNLLYSFEQLKPSIVEGTKHVLELALSNRLKHLVYISSDAVYANLNRCYSESFLSKDEAQQLKSGYSQAKWCAEQLIKLASEKHQLPFFIFRLGNLSPHSKIQVINPKDANYQMISFILLHQKIPDDLSLEFTPVDNVITFINQTVSLKEVGKFYSISGFNQLNAQDLCQQMDLDKSSLLSREQFLKLLDSENQVILKFLYENNLFIFYDYHLEKVWDKRLSLKQLKLSPDALKSNFYSYVNEPIEEIV